MGYSKRQYVTAAFEELGLASYVFDLSPELLEGALRRLDAMMAQWNGQGIRLSYPLPGSPENSDIDAETSVPDSANEAIIAGLAVRIAPSIGKVAQAETKVTAKAAFDVLASRACQPIEMRLPASMPSGSGTKPWRRDQPFLYPTDPGIDAGSDGQIEFT
jgi:hypothetical protein